MKKLIAIPAYTWAIVCMLLIPITFIGNNFFAQKLATMPFMKVNPIYTGGDSASSLKQENLTVTIHKPVFESLLGKASTGFVQVKFSGGNHLPALIKSRIDYNNDNKSDFVLNINTLNGETKLESLSEEVTAIDVSSKVDDYWIVRVKLLNPDKK